MSLAYLTPCTISTKQPKTPTLSLILCTSCFRFSRWAGLALTKELEVARKVQNATDGKVRPWYKIPWARFLEYLHSVSTPAEVFSTSIIAKT